MNIDKEQYEFLTEIPTSNPLNYKNGKLCGPSIERQEIWINKHLPECAKAHIESYYRSKAK